MIRRIKECNYSDIPHYLYREPIEYVELVCDCCHEETDSLYEYDGRELCEYCLLGATKIVI